MAKDFMTEFRERLCRLERIIGDMDEIIAQLKLFCCEGGMSHGFGG